MMDMKKVMVVDKGGRGNAIAHAYARSSKVSHVYVAPGNAGSSLLPKCQQVDIKSIDEILDYVQKNDVDLIDVGPEGYLTNGIVDRFYEAGIRRIVGPTKKAGILEDSKCWAKEFWNKIGVPIPEYKIFDNPDEAKRFITEFYRQNPGENLVVKADGLAAGKGSIVCNKLEDALLAVDRIMIKGEFDDLERGIKPGGKILVEKRLYGCEMMFFVITDGRTILPLNAAMDFKRAFDPGDLRITKYFGGINPNTGGLISISPHPLYEELKDRIMEEIAIPTLTKFKELTGLEYRGIGYFCLMITKENGELTPRVLEFNKRHGDPEAQAILPRLRTDYYELANAVVERRLDEITLEWEPFWCYALVAVSGNLTVRRGSEDKFYPGYPAAHLTNQPIRGLRNVDPSCILYHNGTAFVDPSKGDEDNNIHTTGGRVLTLVSKGETLEKAKETAEREMKKIFFRGMRFRKNINEY
jgi:phosphoribosylamine--glycine ligase